MCKEMGMELFVKAGLFQTKQHNSIFQAMFGSMVWCKKTCIIDDVSAICPLEPVSLYFSKTKIKGFHTFFCITGA